MRNVRELVEALLVPVWILSFPLRLAYRAMAWGKRRAVLEGYDKWQAGDPDGAVLAFSRALELDADYVPALAGRGRVLLMRGDRPGAVADYSRAIALQPGQLEHRWQRAAASEPAEAIEDYSVILGIRPKEVRAYLARAAARGQAGAVAGALRDYDAAIALKPDSFEAWLARSDVRAKHGDYAGAVADLDRVLELQPSLTNVVPGNRGLWKLRSGDRAGAMGDYTLAIDTHPHTAAEAWFNRGLLRQEDGDLAGAITDFSGTIACFERLQSQLRPGSPHFGDSSRLWKKAHLARAKARQASGDEAGAAADRAEVERLRGLKNA